MMEAIKSWVSLSEAEKLQFVKKYEICKLNHHKKLANYLSKTQPYLKKKKEEDGKRSLKEQETKRKDSTTINFNNETTDVEQRTENNDEQITVDNSSHNLVENVPSADITDNLDINRSPESQDSLSSNHPTTKHTCGVLAEPATPSVRTGRELYDVIQSSQGEGNAPYTSLTNSQKRRYQIAASLVKQNYILKFKAYLESLPPKELFDYYNNYKFN